jgi:hypothetical protein
VVKWSTATCPPYLVQLQGNLILAQKERLSISAVENTPSPFKNLQLCSLSCLALSYHNFSYHVKSMDYILRKMRKAVEFE